MRLNRRSPDPSLLDLLPKMSEQERMEAVMLLERAGAYTIKIVANEWESQEFRLLIAGKWWAAGLWNSCNRLVRSEAQVRGHLEQINLTAGRQYSRRTPDVNK